MLEIEFDPLMKTKSRPAFNDENYKRPPYDGTNMEVRTLAQLQRR
jgi:hypothetical protein